MHSASEQGGMLTHLFVQLALARTTRLQDLADDPAAQSTKPQEPDPTLDDMLNTIARQSTLMRKSVALHRVSVAMSHPSVPETS